MTAISGVLDWSGIWRSKDRGVTWEQLTRGLPPGREFGRTSLATSQGGIRVSFTHSLDPPMVAVWVSSGLRMAVSTGVHPQDRTTLRRAAASTTPIASPSIPKTRTLWFAARMTYTAPPTAGRRGRR